MNVFSSLSLAALFLLGFALTPARAESQDQHSPAAVAQYVPLEDISGTVFPAGGKYVLSGDISGELTNTSGSNGTVTTFTDPHGVKFEYDPVTKVYEGVNGQTQCVYGFTKKLEGEGYDFIKKCKTIGGSTTWRGCCVPNN